MGGSMRMQTPGSTSGGRLGPRACGVVALAFVAALGTPTGALAQEPEAVLAGVSGVVIDAVNEAPLEGTSIVLDGIDRSTSTDAAGRFALADIPVGAWVLRLTRLGYDDQLVPITVVEDGEPITIRLYPSPVEIEGVDVVGRNEVALSGVVLDARTGEGLPWAQVRFGARQARAADERGGFRVDGVKPGKYLILAEKLGYESLYVPVEPSGSDEPIVIVLEPDDELMAGIQEMVERIDKRRNAFAFGPARIYDESRLQRSLAPDAALFLQNDANVLFEPCQGSDMGLTCIVSRSRLVRPNVIVDEFPVPCGLSYLASFLPSDFHSVEVYNRGRTIRFYTREYMKRTGRRNQALIPAEYAPRSLANC